MGGVIQFHHIPFFEDVDSLQIGIESGVAPSFDGGFHRGGYEDF